MTNSTSESRILISGPTGTGRVSCKKIHKNSSRSQEPFVIINAALLRENTYEKELFGEEFEDGNVSLELSKELIKVRCLLMKFLKFLLKLKQIFKSFNRSEI